MTVQREGVHDEGVGEKAEVLAGVPDGVGASEPQGVVEAAVDALGIVATGMELGEVGIAADGPLVLGSVEASALS